MTKIKIYPIDTNISGGDKWIGTDSNSNGITKNFTVSGLVDYLNNVSAINLSNSLKFKYDTVGVGDDRAIESFSFETEVGATVDFSSISSLMFHKNASNGKNIVNLMSAFSGNIVMLSKVDEPNKFAFYKITSYEQNITETDFYDTSLSYIQGNGSIEEDEFYFLSLLQFDNILGIDLASASQIGIGNVVKSTDADKTGIDVVYSGGTATVGFNIDDITQVSSLNEPDDSFIPFWNEPDGENQRISSQDLALQLSGLTSRAFTITDTATVTHSLNTKDVIIQLYDITTNETVYADVDRISITQATITFATTPTNSIRVLVQKIG